MAANKNSETSELTTVNEKGETSTLTMDHLKDYLQRNSSPKRKLSFNEILTGISLELMEGIGVQPSDNKMVYDTKDAVGKTKKQLERLLKSYGTRSHPILKNSAGIHIYCTDKVWEPDSEGKRMLPDTNKKVFYAQSVLDEESVNILRDSLEVFPYAEPAVTFDIISRLNRLTPVYNRAEYDPKRVSAVKYPGTYYKNVSEIMKALSGIIYDGEEDSSLDIKEKKMSRAEYERKRSKKIKKISFEYYAYNEKKELELRRTKDGSAVRTADPVRLMWSNGYYYLVTVIPRETGFTFINYRVDRMKNVRCLDEDAVIPKDFSPDKYRSKNPVMYPGKGERVIELRCSRSLINNAIDTFGFDIEITPDKNDSVIIRLRDTSPEGVRMWALEYGFGCEILSPKSLREDMRKAAAHLMKLYD